MYIEEVLQKWRKGWSGKIRCEQTGDEFILHKINTTYCFNKPNFTLPAHVNLLNLNHSFVEIIPKPVDFITAAKSGKNIKPKNNLFDNVYHPLTTWLGRMSSGNAHGVDPVSYISDEWYIEED